MGRCVEIRGVLRVEVKSELNRAKQHPLVVDFLDEEGEIMFSAFGARLADGRVLNSQTALASGKVMTHSFFSPAMQEALINGRKDELADEETDLIRERDERIEYHMCRSKEQTSEKAQSS
jgi:hypothetical protein